MTIWPDLSQRSDEAELMDSPQCDPHRLTRTLQQFRWINRWLTPCHRLIRQQFLSVMARDRNRVWSLVDVGAGGCDLLIWIAQWCASAGIEVKLTCLDYDPRVVEFAQHRCRAWPNIDVIQRDAIDLIDRDASWDFVFANHVLHHLSTDAVVSVVKSADAVAREALVLCDIHRTRGTCLAYSLLWPMRFTNSFCWHDGRLSIRKSFTVQEYRELLWAADLADKASVHRCFPGHLALIRSGCSRSASSSKASC
ncbi:MAG: methyltransferase domain-containing protein [Pirellulaceae bacterium]|nr:methyltransferase domain-containing protein [Pirellulaceae bacterium]